MEKIDIALNNYFTSGDQNLLIHELDNPEKLLTPGLLPKDSPLLHEAETIIDSLNAYNNQIDNSIREDDLESISPDSPLYSWRSLVLGIKMFYLNDRNRMISYLNEIHKKSPLKNISKALLNPNNRDLYIHDLTLGSDVDTIKDAIELKDIDLYKKGIALLRESIKNLSIKDRENIILTIIEESQDSFNHITIFKATKGLVDIYTRYRVMALGYIFTNPVVSIAYWVQSIVSSEIEFNRDLFNTTIDIIRDIVLNLISEKYKIKGSEKSLLAPYLDKLYIQLDRLYPRDIKTSSNILTNLKRYLDVKEKRKSIKTKPKQQPLQMELF